MKTFGRFYNFTNPPMEYLLITPNSVYIIQSLNGPQFKNYSKANRWFNWLVQFICLHGFPRKDLVINQYFENFTIDPRINFALIKIKR